MSLCGRWFNVWNAMERERIDSGMICDFSALPPDYAWYVKLKHQDTQRYYWWDVVWGGVGLFKLTKNEKGRAITDPALYCSM